MIHENVFIFEVELKMDKKNRMVCCLKHGRYIGFMDTEKLKIHTKFFRYFHMNEKLLFFFTEIERYYSLVRRIKYSTRACKGIKKYYMIYNLYLMCK